MSDLSKHLGKKETFTINGEKIELKALGAKDIDIFFKLGDDIKASKELIRKVLKTSYPSATEKELDEFPVSQDLLKAIFELHGFELPEVTQEDLKKLKK